MTSNIPAALRASDIGRFALRAAQIEKAKPVVAYWCEWCCFPRDTTPADHIQLRGIGNYHIVNQIIERGLHNTDDETKSYTTDLVDKLEQVSRDGPSPRIASATACEPGN